MLVAKSVDLSNIRKSLGKSNAVFALRLMQTILRIFLHFFQLAEMEGIGWLENYGIDNHLLQLLNATRVF